MGQPGWACGHARQPCTVLPLEGAGREHRQGINVPEHMSEKPAMMVTWSPMNIMKDRKMYTQPRMNQFDRFSASKYTPGTHGLHHRIVVSSISGPAFLPVADGCCTVLRHVFWWARGVRAFVRTSSAQGLRGAQAASARSPPASCTWPLYRAIHHFPHSERVSVGGTLGEGSLEQDAG